MNVASLELCKELYKLSGWDDYSQNVYNEAGAVVCPAYDLGYLLRKLPMELVVSRCTNGDWSVKANGTARVSVTPEVAAAKLAIVLIKQGILQKEGDEN